MNLKELLTNEAISNYLVFGAGLVVGLVIHFIRVVMKKPTLVRVERILQVSLLDLKKEARARLKVTFDEIEVGSFHETVFSIKNISPVTVDDVNLKLYLEADGKQKIYDMVIHDPLEDLRKPSATIDCIVEEEGTHYLRIRIPFMNSFRGSGDELAVKIYSPEPIVPECLVGGGRGWSAEYFDHVAYIDKLKGAMSGSTSVTGLAYAFSLIIKERLMTRRKLNLKNRNVAE